MNMTRHIFKSTILGASLGAFIVGVGLLGFVTAAWTGSAMRQKSIVSSFTEI